MSVSQHPTHITRWSTHIHQIRFTLSDKFLVMFPLTWDEPSQTLTVKHVNNTCGQTIRWEYFLPVFCGWKWTRCLWFRHFWRLARIWIQITQFQPFSWHASKDNNVNKKWQATYEASRLGLEEMHGFVTTIELTTLFLDGVGTFTTKNRPFGTFRESRQKIGTFAKNSEFCRFSTVERLWPV